MRRRLHDACAALIAAVILASDCHAQQFPAPIEANGNVVAAQALDHALQAWVANLFVVWMRDATGQPDRAIAGANKAIAAYHFARNRIGLGTAPRGQIKALLQAALDQAFRSYSAKLFNSWMHETGGRPSARQEQAIANAMKHYNDARRAIDEQW